MMALTHSELRSVLDYLDFGDTIPEAFASLKLDFYKFSQLPDHQRFLIEETARINTELGFEEEGLAGYQGNPFDDY